MALAAGRLFSTLDEESFPGAVVPRFRDGRYVYYVVADSPGQWRKLAPLVYAAVGSTLSDFASVPSQLDPGDEFEAILASEGLTAARITPAGQKPQRQRAAAALADLADGLVLAARTPQPSLRSTASLLRDFDLAVALGDRLAAEGVIEQLRSDARLEGLNEVFMRIEAMASAGAWWDLWRMPRFEEASRTFRPPRVTLALLRATYWASLDEAVRAGDADGAIEIAKADILPRWGTLSEARPTAATADVWLPLIVAALANGVSAPERPDGFDSTAWTPAQQAFLHAVAPGFAASRRPDGEPAPSTEDFDPGELTARLIDAATRSAGKDIREIGSLLDGLDAVRLKAITEHLLAQKAWDIVRVEAGDGTIRGWLDWAARLPELDLGRARAWAKAAAAEQAVEEVLSTPEGVSSFTDSLVAAASNAETTVNAVIPIVLDWLCQDPDWPRPEFGALYRGILDILLLTRETSALLVAGVGRIADGLVSIGMDTKTYRGICEELAEYAADVASSGTIDPLLDMAEALVVHPCPAPDARVGVWTAAVTALRPYARRLEPVQFAVIQDLDSILSGGLVAADIRPAPHTGDDIPASADLRGRVAVYTLVESVARRVKETVEAAAPNVRVDYSTDKVATDRLLGLARDADVFVIDWSRAKHAATEFITEHRPGRRVIYATGSGSSSIARLILAALTEANGTAAAAA